MLKYPIGTRVRVTIPNSRRLEYALGAVEALNGMLGTITEHSDKNAQMLVTFDAPAPKWWANQTPAAVWWFALDEVTPC